jgi:putative transcriptional regulator
MNIHPGTVIISAPSLEDPHFKKSVIIITEYNKNGASGFVINKPFHRKFNELTEFIQSKPFTLYAGGPVDTENLFVLHQRSDLVKGGTYLFGTVYMGGNFQQAVRYINDGSINNAAIKLFIGYCGWNAGELETEIAEGSWMIIATNKDIVFTDGYLLWDQLLEKNR